MLSSDVRQCDLAHIPIPHPEQVLILGTPKWGTQDEPLPHSYITSSDVHTRDLAHMAYPYTGPIPPPDTPFWGT